ncbi:hypothetical protein CROQUDRAFT_135665 [Cronartium quercuum f. sp. fusiforme G11]|uniref:Uncharacterized protein n=1 Tax=Cronartium quercuum f. sp. fusiforme G11 TaxID=708437 RepID=A0A9P6NDK0_9BASI|nr:hypothetical protein CROQUDRAFT_135665 [Cronartium quercuum f. sp. fusiforme G11]
MKIINYLPTPYMIELLFNDLVLNPIVNLSDTLKKAKTGIMSIALPPWTAKNSSKQTLAPENLNSAPHEPNTRWDSKSPNAATPSPPPRTPYSGGKSHPEIWASQAGSSYGPIPSPSQPARTYVSGPSQSQSIIPSLTSEESIFLLPLQSPPKQLVGLGIGKSDIPSGSEAIHPLPSQMQGSLQGGMKGKSKVIHEEQEDYIYNMKKLSTSTRTLRSDESEGNAIEDHLGTQKIVLAASKEVLDQQLAFETEMRDRFIKLESLMSDMNVRGNRTEIIS